MVRPTPTTQQPNNPTTTTQQPDNRSSPTSLSTTAPPRDTGFSLIPALPAEDNFVSEIGFGIVHFVSVGVAMLPVLLRFPNDHIIPMVTRFFYTQAAAMALRMPVYLSTTFPSTKYVEPSRQPTFPSLNPSSPNRRSRCTSFLHALCSPTLLLPPFLAAATTACPGARGTIRPGP